MSGSHEKLPWLFWVQLVLVAIVAVLFFILRPTGHGAEHDGGAAHEAKSQALKPIGKVVVSSDATSSGGGERTGKEIVDKTCQTCHAAGIADAPKLDESGKASWEARFAQGIDTMMQTAKTGKGAMPPMGTDPTLSDAELKNAIVYMLGKAGVDVSSLTSASASVSESAATSTATPEAESNSEEAKPAEAKQEASEDMSAPAAPSAPTAPEPPATATETSAPEAASVIEASATTAAAPVAETKPAIDGAKIYSTTCFACHDTGVAGAPKVGDKAAWEARVAKGADTLYESAIKGKASPAGVMPPKGGYMNLSDDEVKAIVDYMMSRVQ